MSDLFSEGWATALRSLTSKATLRFRLVGLSAFLCLFSGAGCSVRVFARVDAPVKSDGVSLALDDHVCDFQDNSDSGDEPTLDLDLIFYVRNGASSRVTIHPSRVSLIVHGRSYPPDAFNKDISLRPRSSHEFHAHFSYDGGASCTSNLAVTTDHVIELDGRELPLRPLTFQPSDQDAD
jgi:hypothetical protein